MNQAYLALVEAVADKMIEGDAYRVPLDSLSRAASLGFSTDTFENDVWAEIQTRKAPVDPRQASLFTRFPTE